MYVHEGWTYLDLVLEDVAVGAHEAHGHDQLVQLVDLFLCVVFVRNGGSDTYMGRHGDGGH